MNIAVFCSGKGTNLQAIIDAKNAGRIKVNIALVVSDTPAAYALVRAKNAGIKTLVVKREDYKTRQEFENKIIEELEKKNIDLICLAGYMRMLSASFVARYKNKILNIHPALLPSFKGTSGVKDALEYGVKITGPTVHFVDEKMDHGPIILQRAVNVSDDDTEQTLAEKIHEQEHIIYPEAIRLLTEGKLKIEGRRVRILQCVLALFICSIYIINAGALTTEDITLPISNIVISKQTPLKTTQIPPVEVPVGAQIQPKTVYVPTMQEGQTNINIFKSKDNSLDIYFKDLYNPTEQFSKEQIQENKIKFAKDVADKATEVADTLHLKPLSSIIEVGKKVIDIEQTLKKKFNLHIKVDTDKAFLSYRKKF